MLNLLSSHREVAPSLQLLLPRHLFTPAQLEVQLCGLARVELAFLRRHTMYLAGLQEEDPHIRLFWSVLAGFTQDQLGRLVKFACNQVFLS